MAAILSRPQCVKPAYPTPQVVITANQKPCLQACLVPTISPTATRLSMCSSLSMSGPDQDMSATIRLCFNETIQKKWKRCQKN